MAHFFLDEGATAKSMVAAKSITVQPGNARFVGLWGALVDGDQILVPVSTDDTVAIIATDPFGRNIPTYSNDEHGNLHRISVIGRKAGRVELLALYPRNKESIWARVPVVVTGSEATQPSGRRVRLHDRRLSGLLPRSTNPQLDTVVLTSGDISTSTTIENVAASWRKLISGNTTASVGLEIYCHGLHLRPSKRPINAGMSWFTRELVDVFGSHGEGGAGFQLGKDLITKDNIDNVGLDKWKGKFDLITLYVCGSAYIEPGLQAGLGSSGDGWWLCQRLARLTQTPVMASSAIQTYNIDRSSGEINFGAWEGTVHTINP